MLNKIIIVTIVVAILLGGAYFVGRTQGKEAVKSKEEVVSSRVILERIQEKYFLVTKSLFLDTEAEIKIEEREGWKGLFVGESINAAGVIRTDIGVDLSKLSTEDIIIDAEKKTVSVYLPEAGILDSSLFGDLKIETKKGIWTSIEDFFKDDESEEYNRAVRELRAQAELSAREQAEIFSEARENTVKLIEMIVGEMEYRVIINNL